MLDAVYLVAITYKILYVVLENLLSEFKVQTIICSCDADLKTLTSVEDRS